MKIEAILSTHSKYFGAGGLIYGCGELDFGGLGAFTAGQTHPVAVPGSNN
jgi:hypothetical protein